MNRRLEVIDWTVGAAVALLALVVYSVTCSVGAYPGTSARELVTCLGLFAPLSPENPIWRWVAGGIGSLAGARAVSALNAFAVVCGAVAVWQTYRITSLALRLTISVREIEESRARIAAMVGGVASALSFAFCMPFWVSATRASQESFHAVMLLGTLWLFLAWWRDGRTWQLLLTWIACSLGVVELATFIPFVPILGGFTLYRLLQMELLNRRQVLLVVAAAVVPLGLYAAVTGMFVGTEGYELRGYESFGQVLWFWWRDQYMLLRHGLPQVGWLLILCLTVVPWLAVLAVGRHSLNRTRDTGLLLLHVVLAGVVAVTLLNLKISPWRLVGWGQMLVTPYLLASLVWGYLTAYALLLPQAWWSREMMVREAIRRKRDRFGVALALPFVAIVAVASFRNVSETDARPAAFVNEIARDIVDALGEREWLVTDGTVDNHVLLVSREHGKRLQTINLFDRTDVYMRLLASRFADPAYRNLMQVSTPGFVREWLARDPSSVQKVAVFSEPDLWLAAGYSALPSRLLYLGRPVEQMSSVQTGDLLAYHRTFWDGMKGRSMEEKIRQPADWLNARLVRHAGSVANNLGVLLEDCGQTNEAFSAYQTARRIDSGNISALLNLGVLVDRGYVTDAKDAIRGDLEALQKTVKQKLHAWTLSRHYGYVRVPELYVQVGWNWVLSGQPGLGVSRLLKAVELSSDPARAQVAQQALAYAFLAQNEQESGEAVCMDLLRQDPSNVVALVGMSRLSLRNRDVRSAVSYLERAEKAGAPARTLGFDWASIHLASGDTAKARVILERMVDEDPGMVRAWAMLAGVLEQEKDTRGVERCLLRLESSREGRGVAALVRGKIAMDGMDLPVARRNLDVAHKAMPGHVGALELLIRLDLVQAKQDLAKTHALELLRLRPNHALGNYVLGTIHLSEGKLDVAEDSLRRSMAVEKTPAVLNDLGWLLYKKGRQDEAEELTRAALAMRSDMYQAWDTLAAILMKKGRLDEAGECLDKALSIFADDPVVHLHKIDLLLLRGQKDAARQALAVIKGKRETLPLEEKLHYDTLSRSLTSDNP